MAEKSTYPVNVSTFIELYTYRSSEAGGDYSNVSDYYGMFYTGPNPDGSITMECAGGSITFSTKDLGIKDWLTVLSKPDDFSSVGKAALGISCLELSALHDTAYEATVKLDMYENPMSYGLSIIKEHILPKMSDRLTLEKLMKGNKVKCYSGVYDYYIDGMMHNGELIIMLSAEK